MALCCLWSRDGASRAGVSCPVSVTSAQDDTVCDRDLPRNCSAPSAQFGAKLGNLTLAGCLDRENATARCTDGRKSVEQSVICPERRRKCPLRLGPDSNSTGNCPLSVALEIRSVHFRYIRLAHTLLHAHVSCTRTESVLTVLLMSRFAYLFPPVFLF